MSRMVAFLCFLMSFLLAGAYCHAETVRVLTGNIEPYAIENGPRPGFAIEIVQEMGRRAGIDVEINFMPWQRALLEASLGHDVAIVPVVRTVEREALYSWIQPIMPGEPFYLLAIRPDVDISSFEAVRNSVIGGMANAPAESILRRAGLRYLDLSTDNIINARKLLAGRFDVWFAREAEAKLAMTRLGESPARLRRGFVVDAPPSYLAASRDFSPLIARRLAKAFDSMKADGSYERIVNSYGYGWLARQGP
ncbi:substrate-binding periplasmic protein [Telmatospirillum siberiense]|uniref:Solute-binding protein family 3/N-terminal domain-containing protein n=1 Tax=Telmatospirillum siberiense TaxID=382514 RepID=A0A2N3Q1K7_9PROT|nr:transporter substrate-binding domain-containing protein [Telmatospirillum siberiense]PKU26542.1 hypothetical protein CWS72_01490 [Telmatospirillum siberiense]